MIPTRAHPLFAGEDALDLSQMHFKFSVLQSDNESPNNAAIRVYNLKNETVKSLIDNNPVENAIRPIALGKKNWLFAGSERAGKRAAAIQSLFATAKLNGIEPAAWLKDTLEKLPVWTMRRIDELLPIKPAA